MCENTSSICGTASEIHKISQLTFGTASEINKISPQELLES